MLTYKSDYNTFIKATNGLNLEPIKNDNWQTVLRAYKYSINGAAHF